MSRKKSAQTSLPSGYTVQDKLGESTTTVVWSVTCEDTGKRQALKIVNDPDPAHRLQREYAILARLDHPGIIAVHESGQHKGRDYYTMELLDGESFTDSLADLRGKKDFVNNFLDTFQKSLVILTDLHKQGIVHIDVKPSNLLVTSEGKPVLLDFGFAEDYVLSPTAEASGTTLDYAAPELFTGGVVSPAADIYSLGAMAYEVLSCKKLWEGLGPRQLIAAKLRTPPGMGKTDVDVPPGLETLVLRMINPDPGLRPTAAEVLSETAWLMGEKDVDIEAPVMIPRLVFGDRDEEMAEIERLVFDEKKVVLLNGESGMGKTRLLRELRFKSIVGGRNVLYVEGRGAHLSLVEHLSSALGLNDTVKSTDKWSRYERVYQGIEKAGFDSVFIDSPVDLTDDEKGLLGYLSRGFDGTKRLLLSQTPAQVHPDAVQVELRKLAKAKIDDLVARTFEGLETKNKLAQTLSSIAKGNPRKMNELLDILHTEGWLLWDRGWIYEPKEDAEGLTEKLEDWLGKAIEQIKPDAKIIINLLAISNFALPSQIFDDVVGENFLDSITELINRGLVHSLLYSGRLYYDLNNDLLKSSLKSRTTTSQQKELAKKLVYPYKKYQAKLWGDDISNWEFDSLIQISSLYIKAGIKKKAVHFILETGELLTHSGHDLPKVKELLEYGLSCNPSLGEKIKTLACLGRISTIESKPKEAENYYSEILSLKGATNDNKAQALVRIGGAYQNVYDLDKAEMFFNRSEEIVSEPSDNTRYLLLLGRAWNERHRGNMKKACSLQIRALNYASSSREHYTAHNGLQSILFSMSEPKKAIEHCKKALKYAEESGDKNGYCRIILDMIRPLQTLGLHREVEKNLDKAQSVLKKIRNPITMVHILRHKNIILRNSGQHRKALVLARQAIEILRRINHQSLMYAFMSIEVKSLINLGEWETAHNTLKTLWKEYHGTSSQTPMSMYLLIDWALLFKAKGEFKNAWRMFKKSERLAESRHDNEVIIWLLIYQSQISLNLNEITTAKSLIAKCKSMIESKTRDDLQPRILMIETEILLKEGKNDTAAKVSSLILPVIERNPGAEKERGYALRIIGTVKITTEKFNEGLKNLYQSLEIFKAREQPYEHGLTLYAIAEALFKHQDCFQEAVEALEEAQTIFGRLGAKYYLEKIKELREKHMVDRQDKGSEQYLAKLKQVSELIKDLRAEHLSEENGKLGLTSQYLEGLKEVSLLINRRLGKENFMEDLLDIVLKLTNAQRGVIFYHEDGRLHPVASEKIDEATSKDALCVSHTVIDNLRKGLDPVYTSDALTDDRFQSSESILLNDIRSLMCIPLKTEDALIGTIYVDSKQTGLFDAPRIIFFEAIGNLLAVSVEKSAEFKQLREDLVLAQQKRSFEETGIVLGSSPVMKKLYSQLEKVASTDTNILLQGETGTGKGVFARMIHERSGRKDREFCIINCGILPENIFESELFGTKKGAFTGATTDRMGLLEAAHCSTVFFDEITNTSPAMQAKLLEVIEEKVIRRMGETKQRQVNLRFIFATNRDLAEEVKAGRFRKDLYYRISGLTIKLPPLRKRKKDLPQFIDFFLNRFSREFNKEITGIDEDAQEKLLHYPWPGNIRELRNVIERSVLLASESRITADIVEQYLAPLAETAEKAVEDLFEVEELNLEQARKKFEEKLIRQALARHDTVEEAAEALGISRTTLWRKMSMFGIKPGG